MSRFLTLALVLAFASNAAADEAGPTQAQRTLAQRALAKAAPGQRAADLTQSSLTLRSIAAGTDVQDRRLVGESTTFQTGAPVWVHIAVRNTGPEDQVKMVWLLEGDAVWAMDLDVGTSAGWRTWTRMRMPATRTGQWTVEVHDTDGRLMGDVMFDVVGRSASVKAAPVKAARARAAPVEAAPVQPDEDAPAKTAALFDDEPGC
jgi:hypothetical protein